MCNDYFCKGPLFHVLHRAPELPDGNFWPIHAISRNGFWLYLSMNIIIATIPCLLVGAVNTLFPVTAHAGTKSTKAQLYRNCYDDLLYYLHWVGIEQGNCLALDRGKFKVFSNTLQGHCCRLGFFLSGLYLT